MAVNEFNTWLPEVPTAMFQAPEVVHELALVLDQVRVLEPLYATLLGLALIDTVGAAEVTEMVAFCVALPPVPVQVKV